MKADDIGKQNAMHQEILAYFRKVLKGLKKICIKQKGFLWEKYKIEYSTIK